MDLFFLFCYKVQYLKFNFRIQQRVTQFIEYDPTIHEEQYITLHDKKNELTDRERSVSRERSDFEGLHSAFLDARHRHIFCFEGNLYTL